MPELAYATLIGERVIAVMGPVSTLSQAVTIATRYAAVRRQSEDNAQILDFPAVYSKLVPIICTVYSLRMIAA